MFATITKNAVPAQPLIMRILVRPFAYRHRKFWATTQFMVGTWLSILGGILCSYRFWWGSALFAVALLQIWIGRRLMLGPQS